MLMIESNPYKSIIIYDEDGELITISEGNGIEFSLESTGEVVKGVVTKFQGKDEKLKIQMFNPLKNCEEIWPVVLIKEGSLKLVVEDENEDDE